MEVPLPDDALCGIYFLMQGDQVVYVGQSADVHTRISSHYRARGKRFNRVAVIPCDEREMSRLEVAFIRDLKPIYNKSDLPAPIGPIALLDKASDIAVGFIAHTDEDGIVADELYRRVADRCALSDRIAFFRRMDKDARVIWSREDGVYRLRIPPVQAD